MPATFRYIPRHGDGDDILLHSVTFRDTATTTTTSHDDDDDDDDDRRSP